MRHCVYELQRGGRAENEHGFGDSGRSGGRRDMNLVTIAVVGVIVISYLVGTFTSSVETEQKLPHRY
jgi:hypothetical protein